jgi:hypothetical protein
MTVPSAGLVMAAPMGSGETDPSHKTPDRLVAGHGRFATGRHARCPNLAQHFLGLAGLRILSGLMCKS